MDLRLRNKIVIITGGARGIGEAIVRSFAKEGSTIYFTYHQSKDKALALEEALLKEGSSVQAVECDVRDSDNIAHICKEAGNSNSRIDVLVNNAGINKDSLVIRTSEENWNEILQTNLSSAFLFTKFTLPFMLKNGGSIINISSVTGSTGNAGQAAYAASKGGLIAFTKSVAKEYGSKNIRCNAVAPGLINTDMTSAIPDAQKDAYLQNIPLKRFGEPGDVAGTVLFLAGQPSSYISGQVFHVCGGLHS